MADHRPSPDTSLPGEDQHEQTASLQGSFEDEVTSIVNTDIHRAITQDDLNDRVVDQTTLELDDGSDYPDDDDRYKDDRFDLLARGGRDSVSQARNRMRLRRSGEPIGFADNEMGDETPSHIDTASKATFLPDDYIEEEAPASEDKEASSTSVNPNDDVMLSEGVSQGNTPRSRRLRRSTEAPPDPKSGAVVGTDTNVATPAIEFSQGSAPGRDRFNSIPEISTSIDLSRLRQREQGNPDDTIPTPRFDATVTVDLPVEDRFERAVRRAQETQSIKAAARSEREGRQTSDRRARATPPPSQEDFQPAPVPRSDLVSNRTDHRDVSFSDDEVQAIIGGDIAHQPLTRERISTRDQFIEDAPAYDEVEQDEIDFRESNPREKASTSWWRGILRRREAESTEIHAQDTEWDDYGDLPETFEYQSSNSAAHDAWNDGAYEAWEDEHDVTDQSHVWMQDESPIPSSEDPHLFWTNAKDEGPDAVANHGGLSPHYEPLDLQQEHDLSAFRDRLFVRDSEDRPSPVNIAPAERATRRSPISLARKRSITHDEPMRAPVYSEFEEASVSYSRSGYQASFHTETYQEQPHEQLTSTHVAPEALLDSPEDARYEPEHDDRFDVRNLITQPVELLDMTIEISPDVTRHCATCRSYRQSEKGGRGWCTNNWAFTHRQMVNATDLACASTIGCWWLPADEEVWLTDNEPERGTTPRVDRLIAHLDPLRRAVGR